MINEMPEYNIYNWDKLSITKKSVDNTVIEYCVLKGERMKCLPQRVIHFSLETINLLNTNIKVRKLL